MTITLQNFENEHPSYAFDFTKPISAQSRIYSMDVLSDLPTELVPGHEYRSGGRGRPNRNQTRTHSQCATCYRLLRNDFYYTPPSLVKNNVIYSHCKTCAQKHNNNHYVISSSTMRSIEASIWSYLAPACSLCGFNQHPSAIDMHHPKSDAEEQHLSKRLTEFVQSKKAHIGEKLLSEASDFFPVCSNCHRMLHAEAIQLPGKLDRPIYKLQTLIKLVEQKV